MSGLCAWQGMGHYQSMSYTSLGGKWVLSAPMTGWGNGQKGWQPVFWLCSSLNQCLLSNCFAGEAHDVYFKHKWFQFFCPGCIETFVRVIPSHFSCESLTQEMRQMKSYLHNQRKKIQTVVFKHGVSSPCLVTLNILGGKGTSGLENFTGVQNISLAFWHKAVFDLTW